MKIISTPPHLRQKQFTLKGHNALEVAKNRLIMGVFCFSFCMLGITTRLVDLTLLRSSAEPQNAAKSLTPQLHTGRADIVDRHGEVLATTILTNSLYANAKVVPRPEEAAAKLMTVLPSLNKEKLIKRLSSDKTFIWIARHLTPQQRLAVLNLGIPGLSFTADQKRIYPQGNLAAHVVGYTDVDNKGIAAVEASMDTRLRQDPTPLKLSLDLRMQHIARDELAQGIQEFGAAGGCAVIMDIRTGEILSMVSGPDFDPNHPQQASADGLFNKATLGIYEVGSIMKVINTAMALETGTVTLKTRFDATQPLKVGRFKVTDFKGKNAWMNVAEIFVHSSNIGSAKMALAAGATKQKAFFKHLGLFNAPKFEISEMGAPMIPKQWSDATTITASYGYGLAFSPLQIIAAIATVTGDGTQKTPSLLYGGAQKPAVQTVSAKVSKSIRYLMRAVVKEGTSKKANVEGYYIFAKTGTANLRQGRSYQTDRVMANFIGVLGTSMDDPRYVVYVMMDDPKRLAKTYGFNTAGWNAAPVGGRIIRRLASLVGMHPFQQEAPESANFFRQASMSTAP